MNKEQFIEDIAKYVKKYAPQFGICVYSPIIAQAILESGCGVSELAINANNFFGIKFRENRCPSSNGIYYKVGSEQNPDGSYVSYAMKWCKFPSFELGVKGYFELINISRYSNLKGITDPKKYLETIKSDGYATLINYVPNLLNVIKLYNLTKYDKGDDSMSNSNLVTYTKISPNKTSPRTHAIDTITIHCMAGNLSVETCGNVFAPTNRKASSNYGIGSDGRIALYVEEKDRSWCSSNSANDNRAITIEVANDGGANTGWHVSDKALQSLILLCADICKRNNIKKLIWSTNKNDRINHLNGCNMTVHRDFAAKACPGEYLYNKHQYIADEVNKLLGITSNNTNQNNTTPTTSNTTNTSSTYLVKITADVLNVRQGAGTNYKVTTQIKQNQVYTIIETKNGWGKLKSGAGWINLSYTTKISDVKQTTSSNTNNSSYRVKITADVLNVRQGAGTNYKVTTQVKKNQVYTIIETKNGWGKLKSGAGWINLSYTTKI